MTAHSRRTGLPDLAGDLMMMMIVIIIPIITITKKNKKQTNAKTN